MHRGCGSKGEVGHMASDSKRVNETLDKLVDRSSVASRSSNGKNNRNRRSSPSKSKDLYRDSRSGPLSDGDMFTEEQTEVIESAAEMLYGLIHVRYILTTKGLAAMLEKYKNADFGRCPRVCCCGQPFLPVGPSDILGQSTVNIYCPKCEDIYSPRSKSQEGIDGAYFGTTFPHLFLMTYGHLKPQKTSRSYVPRVFGFKIHKP